MCTHPADTEPKLDFNIWNLYIFLCVYILLGLTTVVPRWLGSGIAPTGLPWSPYLPCPSPRQMQTVPSPPEQCRQGWRPCCSSLKTRGWRACTQRRPYLSYRPHSAWHCWGSSCRALGHFRLSAACSGCKQHWKPQLEKKKMREKNDKGTFTSVHR